MKNNHTNYLFPKKLFFFQKNAVIIIKLINLV